jgi:hypothetical protein
MIFNTEEDVKYVKKLLGITSFYLDQDEEEAPTNFAIIGRINTTKLQAKLGQPRHRKYQVNTSGYIFKNSRIEGTLMIYGLGKVMENGESGFVFIEADSQRLIKEFCDYLKDINIKFRLFKKII